MNGANEWCSKMKVKGPENFSAVKKHEQFVARRKNNA